MYANFNFIILFKNQINNNKSTIIITPKINSTKIPFNKLFSTFYFINFIKGTLKY